MMLLSDPIFRNDWNYYDSVTEYNTFTMKVMSLISVMNTHKNGSKQQIPHSFETKISLDLYAIDSCYSRFLMLG